MKQVTMTRDMRPYRQNDTATLSDELAEQLVSAGDARDPRPWPPATQVGKVPAQPEPAKRLRTKNSGAA